MGMQDWPGRSDRVTARKFAIIYIVWSALWVVGSDYAMHLAIRGPNVEWKIESYKGLTYVLVSGLILFLAVRERDRKHKRQRQQMQSMLKSLRQSGLIGIFEWRAGGAVIDANKSLLDALGYTREELLAGKLTREAVTPPEYWEVDRLADEEVKLHGRCPLYEKDVIRKDGARLHALVGRALLDGCPDRGIGYALDITEKKQLEMRQTQLQQQLIQSEKLNALGQLAGGIAHDFNNLLSIIIGYTSLTEARLGPSDRLLHENTAQALRAADKAKNLIRKLLAFSRRQVLNPELVNVNELISELNEMLSRVVDERIKFVVRLGHAVGNIEADRSQIEQVVLNLVVNARDAMPNGGTLTIETFTTNSPVVSGDRFDGEYEAIRVSDTGIGMDESVRLRIFEPFFTTKQQSGGTGLGLSTVYGIVKQSGGSIDLESVLGQGSVFTVYLPKARSFAATRQRSKDAQPLSTAGSETILLIEDLPELREMLAAILRAKGYRILLARDGMHAVNLAFSHSGPIHLIISDVIMPGLNGPEAVRRIREHRAGLWTIYMTGYADQAIDASNAGMNSIIIEKPIKPDALLVKIREILGGTHATSKAGD